MTYNVPVPRCVPQYLENFLRRGPSGYGAYCAERLRRTAANGEREEVPCEMELQVRYTVAPWGFQGTWNTTEMYI